jgi:glycosyltransferase involved in cell wall biosynthesis
MAGERTAVISANSAWNILHFRKPIIEALRDAGWRVVALAPPDGHEADLRALGADYIPIEMDSGGTSLWRDGRLFLAYMSTLRRLRPRLFLGFTVKPNVYGSMAARILGIRTINNISGLGTAFIRPGPLNRLVSALYRRSLAKSARVFFQNSQDRDLFVGSGLVTAKQARVIPGSGIDLDHFRPPATAKPPGAPFRFLFIGRLLRDKGVMEYVEAARSVRAHWPEAEFAILGAAGSRNPTAVPISDIERWRQEGVVSWLGETRDVRPFLAEADCVVLPSYREGLPRALLEGAATGRPMIATDVPGCRDVVEDGTNGFLCEVGSAASLAAAMDRMLRLPRRERAAMGVRARGKVEREFNQSLVVKAYCEAIG